MYTSQIMKIIDNDKIMKKTFFGIFARDTLKPLNKNIESAYIANTDKSNSPGEHWILTYVIPDKNEIIFFDSLAFKPSYYGKEFEDWINLPEFKVVKISRAVQSKESTYCGLFVIYYFYYLCRGWSVDDITNTFSSDLGKNDEIVSQFAQKKFKFNARREIIRSTKSVIYRTKFCRDFTHICKQRKY